MHKEYYDIGKGPLSEDLELQAAIHAQFEPFAQSGIHYDLTTLNYKTVINALHGLVASCDIALHGSDSDTPYETLDPAFCRQGTKIPSIFATTDARVALKNAIFRRHGPLVLKIRNEVDDGQGFAGKPYVNNQKEIFYAPPGIAKVIREALTTSNDALFNELFTDGVIYVAAGRLFTREDPIIGEDGNRIGGIDYTDNELNSPYAVPPLATLRVSKQLAYSLLPMDEETCTLHVYTEEEIQERREQRDHVRAIKERLMGERATILAARQE